MTRTDRAVLSALAIVFFAAAFLKIVDPASFAVSIARLRLVPLTVVGPLAILLPWIEAVTAAALFVPRYRHAALLLTMLLLGTFTAVLMVALAGGATGSCGCFGRGDGFLGRADVAVVRNVILLAMAGFLLRKPTSPAAPASPASGTGR